MDQVIAFAVIALIFFILWRNERNFLAYAQTYSATVQAVFTRIRTEERSFEADRKKEIAKQATVKLTQGLNDERQGDITVPLKIWQDLSIGDTIQVLAYPDHPKWVFWSPMIRYEHRDIFVKINSVLTTVFFILTLLSVYWMQA